MCLNLLAIGPRGVSAYSHFYGIERNHPVILVIAIVGDGIRCCSEAIREWKEDRASRNVLSGKVMTSSVDSWRMDETVIKVKGRWVYLYRAADKIGNTNISFEEALSSRIACGWLY